MDARKAAAEQEGMIARYEKEREELEALREFVKQKKEVESTPESILVPEMKKIIAQKKIMIVGGHINWLKKTKSVMLFNASVTLQILEILRYRKLTQESHIIIAMLEWS